MKPFSINKYKTSDFEIKRLLIFEFLSKYGEIIDKLKFKNKEVLFRTYYQNLV